MSGGGIRQKILQHKCALRVLQVIHTSVCRSYANFVRAHPMASSRSTSPVQIYRLQGWTQEPVEDAITNNVKAQSDEESIEKKESNRRRELLEIT